MNDVKASAMALMAALTLSIAYADPMPTTVSTGPITNTSTISASKEISPGTYMMSIMPSFNTEMGARIEKAVAAIPGLKDVKDGSDNSSIHFTVTNKAHVKMSDLRDVVSKAYAGAVVSSPVMERSAPKPKP